MAPDAAFFSFGGRTPSFLARVMALPAFGDAFSVASQVYDATKRNEVMGAALRAAEASVRVAAMGATPLAAPFLDRVGGWEAVDEWACRGLDRVEEAAPIIKEPTKEIVSRTRRSLLGAVAGDQVIVPDTFAEALIARVNRVVDALTDNGATRRAETMAEGALDGARRALDAYLPAGKGDRKEPDLSGAGFGARSLALLTRAGHRLYRTSLRAMRPDLAYFPNAAITLDMVVRRRGGDVEGSLGIYTAMQARGSSLTSSLEQVCYGLTALQRPFSGVGVGVGGLASLAGGAPAVGVALDYASYATEEARLWAKALLVFARLSPDIARRISHSARLLVAAWLRDFMQFIEGKGSRKLRLYKEGFIPVKVTMMAPRETL